MAQRDFWREHAARWLPTLGRALAACGDEFYAAVGLWLAEFLAEEARRLEAPLIHRRGGGRRVPVVGDAHFCTLCGFCVQVCAPRALWVDESAATTRLVLDAARCVGCAQCLRICPEHALRLVQRDGVELAPRALRVSPRARCPICAAPTVSAAELDAVFARVGADEDLRERLSLCAECKTLAEVWR